jgi:hypothetical protein
MDQVIVEELWELPPKCFECKDSKNKQFINNSIYLFPIE